jgi:hypothetical protein
VADRDDGFRQKILGEARPFHQWGRGDAARHVRYLREVGPSHGAPRSSSGSCRSATAGFPTREALPRQPVDLLLGSSRTLRSLRSAGVVGLLFGEGAEGCTTPTTDGGRFFALARRSVRARS